jgi:hypothetical protein
MRSDSRRAVVPPPRLRASPLAFDADDAAAEAAALGVVPEFEAGACVTRIDAPKGGIRLLRRFAPNSAPKKVIKVTSCRKSTLTVCSSKESEVTEKGNLKVIKITFLRKSLIVKGL